MTTGSGGEAPPAQGGAYDFAGHVVLSYSPERDGEPDPGEVVWAWVSYEDDPRVGKDRPVAVLGRTDDGRLAAVMLSSQDHDADRGWVAIGSGPWDPRGRRSWVRTDRLLAVPADAVRREGATLPRPVYDRVVAGLDRRVLSPATPTRRGPLAHLRALFRRWGRAG